MNFINSIKICYTKKYAKFEGRASRSEFWYFILFYYGIIALTIWVDVNYLNKPANEFTVVTQSFSDVGAYFLSGFVIVSTLPYIGVAVRLWIDGKKSGSWRPESLILGFLPLMLCFWSIFYIVVSLE